MVNIMKFCCCSCFSWIEIIVICFCLVVIFADFMSNVVPCTVKVGPSNCAKKTKTMRWFQRNLQYLVSFTAKNKSSDVLCWARNFEHNLKNHISWVKMCVTLVRFEQKIFLTIYTEMLNSHQYLFLNTKLANNLISQSNSITNVEECNR